MKGASKFQHFPRRPNGKTQAFLPGCHQILTSQEQEISGDVYIYIYFNTPSLKVEMVFHQYIGWLKCVPTLLSREHIKLPVISSKIS